MANLRKSLEIKSFRITHQIHQGGASFFVKPFSSRLLQIFNRFNCRFKVYGMCFRGLGFADEKERFPPLKIPQPIRTTSGGKFRTSAFRVLPILILAM